MIKIDRKIYRSFNALKDTHFRPDSSMVFCNGRLLTESIDYYVVDMHIVFSEAFIEDIEMLNSPIVEILEFN